MDALSISVSHSMLNSVECLHIHTYNLIPHTHTNLRHYQLYMKKKTSETGINLFVSFDLAFVEKSIAHSCSKGVFLFILLRVYFTAHSIAICHLSRSFHASLSNSLSHSLFYSYFLCVSPPLHLLHPLFPDYKRQRFELRSYVYRVCVGYISFFRIFRFIFIITNNVANGWKDWISTLILAEVCSIAQHSYLSFKHELLFSRPNERSSQAFSNYFPYIFIMLYVYTR